MECGKNEIEFASDKIQDGALTTPSSYRIEHIDLPPLFFQHIVEHLQLLQRGLNLLGQLATFVDEAGFGFVRFSQSLTQLFIFADELRQATTSSVDDLAKEVLSNV